MKRRYIKKVGARKTPMITGTDDITADKDAKITRLKNLVVTVNTVFYNADGNSIGNMGAVVSLANFKYNQAVALTGATPTQAYQVIYKDTKVTWKGADNKPHDVMIESVCEALEKSMTSVATEIGVPQ